MKQDLTILGATGSIGRLTLRAAKSCAYARFPAIKMWN